MLGTTTELGIVGALWALAGTALAQYTIDFNFDDSGAALTAGVTNVSAEQPYANLFAPGSGVTLSTDKPGTNPLNLYDTESNGGEDPDLERNHGGTGNWDGGSELNTIFGNTLIANDDANISIPDDEGTGGHLILAFDIPLVSVGFDFVDMDAAANAQLRLTDTSDGSFALIPFADFEAGSGSIHETAGVLFGDRHANRILDIRASEVGLPQFDLLSFEMSSSGAIGTIYADVVPEPAIPLLLVPAAGILLCRRARGSRDG